MKLAICYTVFDGLELLEKSIQNINPHVDEIIICYQEISNKGNADKSIHAWLEATFDHYKNIHFVLYQTDLKLNPKENERRKHQLMIDAARFFDCTHFIMAATDHFYNGDQVEFAKKFVIEHDLDLSLTFMYTYYKNPCWQLTPLEQYYMPFICRLYKHTKIEKVSYFPVRVDPSVQINTFQKWMVFAPEHVMLHHYSMIRKDIKGKFENAASPWKPEQIEKFVEEFNGYSPENNDGIYYFQGKKIKIVPDYFDLCGVIS